jgi:tRNA1(Val) A37 N6-methylase TrmN6
MRGYRYGIDSFLLARFARFQRADRVCDLGAGVGILGLLALSRGGVRHVTAVEVQPKLAELARKNAEEMGFGDRVEVLIQNWKNVPKNLKKVSFEVIISNPPYRKEKTGRLPPDPEKAVAKHEIEGTLSNLVKAAAFLMKPIGRFCLMYPPLRLEELIIELSRTGLKIQRMAFIHSYANQPAHLFMAEVVKSQPRELHLEPPVIVYRDGDHYTPEIEAWVGRKKS